MKDTPVLVKNFSEFMLDYKVNSKTFISEFLDIVKLFNLAFDADTVYELFENCHHVLDFYKTKRIPLKNGERIIYSCNDGDSYLPLPDTIDSFIYDCNKHWKINLYWEKSLVKNKWKISFD